MAKESNINEQSKTKDSRVQQIADPLSERLICRPEAEAEAEPELMKKAPVRPYVPPVPFPQRLKK